MGINEPDQTALDAYYGGVRDAIHCSGTLGLANRRMHRSIERHRDASSYPITVELGARGMQHLPAVRHAVTKYIAVDIREFDQDTYLHTTSRFGAAAEEIELLVADARNLPLSAGSVDRVVATCLLMHLPDPYSALAEWLRVCKPTGVIDFLVPCDPGVVLRAIRWFVSEPTAKRHGVSRRDYRLLNAWDHISSFERIEKLVREAAPANRELTIRYLPFRLPFWNINAYAVFSLGPQFGRDHSDA